MYCYCFANRLIKCILYFLKLKVNTHQVIGSKDKMNDQECIFNRYLKRCLVDKLFADK